MARVTYVKRAQARYEMVPVLDEQGQPKRSPVLKKDGTPKTDKWGNPITMAVTVRDLSKPKPLQKCEVCDAEIQVGQPFKWVHPKSSYLRIRCDACPTWQPWDLSNALWARVAQIQADFPGADSFDTPEDVQLALEDIAGQVRELAEEKRESAGNIEDGFGHSTYQSDELNETADSLDDWASEIEGADIPDLPEPEEEDCDECGGTGKSKGGETPNDDDVECLECDGTGKVTPDEPTDEQMDEWRAEVEDACSVVEDCPV